VPGATLSLRREGPRRPSAAATTLSRPCCLILPPVKRPTDLR
jgi:hypothetical protein